MSQLLIETDELARVLSRDDPRARPVVLDVRWTLGGTPEQNRSDYLAGHLPGAVFLDLEHALAEPVAANGAGGRHPMPSLDRATEAFRAAGVSADRPVVVYDAANSLSAARAWWLLRYFGKEEVRVLNGGYAAWLAAGEPVQTEVPDVPTGDVELSPGGRRLVDADGVIDYLAAGQVLDARAAERYRGEQEPIDPVAGHVPGASNLPTLQTVDADGRFLPVEALRRQLADAGVRPDLDTALYCGSGVQACHLALAIEVAEATQQHPGVYIGSWSDWISDPDRPVATGPDRDRGRRSAPVDGQLGLLHRGVLGLVQLPGPQPPVRQCYHPG